MSRRSLTLIIAGIATVIAIVISVLAPVPYVILQPGPTLNTLGDVSGTPLITITGHKTYSTTGHLNMVTVGYQGGPGDTINIWTALRAWVDPSEAVVPEEELFPTGESEQQTQQEDTQEMTGSQQTATAAALNQLGIGYKTQVEVAAVENGYPAEGVLKDGDVIEAVDGTAVTSETALTSLITSHPAGTKLRLTVLRGGATKQLDVTTKEDSATKKPVVGVEVNGNYKFPFNVSISVGDIGGPSAGMMFALGIIDKLTQDNLTGGKFIAGTGEITDGGQVEAIGGIQQKMVGARDAGATVFLAPASNCTDVDGHVPSGLRIVKVSTLSQAMTYLQDIKAGKSVPSC
jgi:PDZ domain-containing protein